MSIRLKQITGIRNILDYTFKESNNFILIFLNRQSVSYNTVKTVIDQGLNYGRRSNTCNKLYFKLDQDDSELTSLRLKLIKKVTENLLSFQGCTIENEQCDKNYIVTTKSEGKTNDKYFKYICGSVLNVNKKKDKVWREEEYKKFRSKKIMLLSSQRSLDLQIDKNNFEKDVDKITNAAVTYQLLSTKHTNPIILEESDRSIKGTCILKNISAVKNFTDV